MSNKGLEYLVKGRELIEKAPALSHNYFFSEDGECYCTMGAIYKARNKTFAGDISVLSDSDINFSMKCLVEAMEIDIGLTYEISIYKKNDASTKEEVLAYFDKAIEIARERV